MTVRTCSSFWSFLMADPPAMAARTTEVTTRATNVRCLPFCRGTAGVARQLMTQSGSFEVCAPLGGDGVDSVDGLVDDVAADAAGGTEDAKGWVSVIAVRALCGSGGGLRCRAARWR